MGGIRHRQRDGKELITVSVELPLPLNERLEAIAYPQNISKSAYVRTLIREHFAELDSEELSSIE